MPRDPDSAALELERSRGDCRLAATGVTVRELDAETSGCGIRITSSSSSYGSDAAAAIGGICRLAEYGNLGPGVCGRGRVAAHSSGMLSAAGTAELSVAGGAAILSDGESLECEPAYLNSASRRFFEGRAATDRPAGSDSCSDADASGSEAARFFGRAFASD